MTTITVRCSVCLGSQSADTLMISNHPYEYQSFRALSFFKKTKSGDNASPLNHFKLIPYPAGFGKRGLIVLWTHLRKINSPNSR